MKFVLALALLSLNLSASPLEAAQTAPSALRLCLTAARLPVTTSHAWRNQDAVHKQALLNGYNADVAAMTDLCVQLDSAPAHDRAALATHCQALVDDQLRRHSAADAAALQRYADNCKAMSNG